MRATCCCTSTHVGARHAFWCKNCSFVAQPCPEAHRYSAFMSRVQKYQVSANQVPSHEFLGISQGTIRPVASLVAQLTTGAAPLLQPGYNFVRAVGEPQAATTHVIIPQSGFIPHRVGTEMQIVFNNTGAGTLTFNTVGNDQIRVPAGTLASTTTTAANTSIRLVAEGIANEGTTTAGMIWRLI